MQCNQYVKKKDLSYTACSTKTIPHENTLHLVKVVLVIASPSNTQLIKSNSFNYSFFFYSPLVATSLLNLDATSRVRATRRS